MNGIRTIKSRVVHRLKIARGHLDKVIALAEEDAYCPDIIHQSQAVQRALAEIDKLILENHLRTCVAEQIRQGQTDTVISEVMTVIDKNG